MEIRIYRNYITPVCFSLTSQESDEWEIVANISERVQTPRELGEYLVFSRRVTLRNTLTLRRRIGFQAYILCIPCITLGALSTLVFVLPPERPDRHAIGMNRGMNRGMTGL